MIGGLRLGGWSRTKRRRFGVGGVSAFRQGAIDAFEPASRAGVCALKILIFAAMQRRFVVRCVCGLCAGAVCGGASPAQRGLLRVLGIGQPALVLDSSETRLDIVEFGSRDDIFVARWKNAGNFFLRVQDAIRGLGMVGKGLGDQTGLPLLKCLHLFKEADESLRLVSGAIHVLHSEIVSLCLEVAREVEERN